MKKKYLCMVIAAAMLFSLMVSATASDIKTRNAELRPDVSIIIDGTTTYFESASGDSLYPILFDGSTYLPLRSIGEIMGKNVNWDEETKTITLSGTRDTYTNPIKTAAASNQTVEIQVREDFTIIIDGVTQTFRDANGDRVYPILYNGSTYLPIRAIGEIMDNDVLWDGDNLTVTLVGSGLTVTDADSFNTTTTTGTYTLDDLKNIALADAGISADSVTFIKAEKDYDDGISHYDIEFVYNGTEYDYEIAIETGTIISKKTETANGYGTTTGSTSSTGYTLDELKNIVLADAGLSGESVTYTKTKQDYDDGVLEYEIDFTYNSTKYEYEIAVSTGKIISKKTEALKYNTTTTTTSSSSNSSSTITAEEAKAIALADAGISESSVSYIKAKLDKDNGIYIYEVEFTYNRVEYDYEINASTGTIIEKDVDYD